MIIKNKDGPIISNIDIDRGNTSALKVEKPKRIKPKVCPMKLKMKNTIKELVLGRKRFKINKRVVTQMMKILVLPNFPI